LLLIFSFISLLWILMLHTSNPCLKLDMVVVSVVECMPSILTMMYWIERAIVLKCFCLNCYTFYTITFFFHRSDIIHITSWLPAFLGWGSTSAICTNKGGRIRCELLRIYVCNCGLFSLLFMEYLLLRCYAYVRNVNAEDKWCSKLCIIHVFAFSILHQSGIQ
jgi:hypothetical protein